MPDSKCRTFGINPDEKNLDEAIRRIYQVYGPDLDAFFRDVQDQLKLERAESIKRSDPNAHSRRGVEA
jgi:hypothetical protein